MKNKYLYLNKYVLKFKKKEAVKDEHIYKLEIEAYLESIYH